VADDLARYLAGEPLWARPPSALDRWRKLARRHRALVVGVTAVVTAVAAGIASTGVMALRESRARHVADQNAIRAIQSANQAQAARAAAVGEAYRARLVAAMAAMGHHDIREAARQLSWVPAELHGWEWRHLHGRLDESLAVVAGLPDGALAAFCPAGQRLAVADARGYRLLDAASGATLEYRTTPGQCRAVYAFRTREGLRLLLDQSTSDRVMFSLTDGDGFALGRVTVPESPESTCSRVMALSPDGRLLAFQRAFDPPSPLVDLYDAATGAWTATCDEPRRNQLLGLDFSPDGTRLAAARSEDCCVRVFDGGSGRSVGVLEGHTAMVRGVAYSADGRRLASCAEDQTVRVWDTATGRLLHTLRGHGGGVYCVAFSPEGGRIVSGGSDSTVRLWSASGGEPLLVLHGHTGAVNRVAFSPDGRTIASTASDGTARLWDALAPEDASVLRGHTNYIYPVAYSPDGRWIASGSWDKTVRLWDAASGSTVRTLEGHSKPVGALAFTRDGTRLASWGEDATIRVWDIATGRPSGTLAHHGMGHRDSAYSLVASPDGRRLGAVSKGGVRFWDLSSLEESGTLKLPLQDVRVVAFSPDGARLTAGGGDASVVVVDAESGKLTAELCGFTGRIQSVSFSPDGRAVLTAGQDRVLRLWDAATGRLLRTFTGHSMEVLTAVFHPDGTRIASGGHDRSIIVWDTAAGDELVRLPGHSSYVFSLAFSPDGETLVSGSGDATVRLWDAFPLARRLRARNVAKAAEALPHFADKPDPAGPR
jgi:WD40 repeat protein